VAWEAPARYLVLVGYGLDDEGKSRGLPYIGAMD
jgi:hypoxanthine phosphoribosyltransferase